MHVVVLVLLPQHTYTHRILSIYSPIELSLPILNTCIHFRLQMQLLIRNISFWFLFFLSISLSIAPKNGQKYRKDMKIKETIIVICCMGCLVRCFVYTQFTGKINVCSSFIWSSFQIVSIFFLCVVCLLVFCCLRLLFSFIPKCFYCNRIKRHLVRFGLTTTSTILFMLNVWFIFFFLFR